MSKNPNGTGQERVATRNLPFYAGSFSSYGLDKEEAVSLINFKRAAPKKPRKRKKRKK